MQYILNTKVCLVYAILLILVWGVDGELGHRLEGIVSSLANPQ